MQISRNVIEVLLTRWSSGDLLVENFVPPWQHWLQSVAGVRRRHQRSENGEAFVEDAGLAA